MRKNEKNSISNAMDKALGVKVTQQIRDDIAAVLDVNTEKMTARQAVVYAQVAKAIKGDKSAFEAISNIGEKEADKEKSYAVEIKVVE